jgi:hypothetical protein
MFICFKDDWLALGMDRKNLGVPGLGKSLDYKLQFIAIDWKTAVNDSIMFYGVSIKG